MPLTYVNRKGDTYYLHEGRTKKGNPKYYFSKKDGGDLVDEVPEGYEIYENPNARVFLRRKRPLDVTKKEISTVEEAIRSHSDLKDFKIDVKGGTMTVFLPDQDLDHMRETFSLMSGADDPWIDEVVRRMTTYSPMMRFVLVDPSSREFRVDRMCFRGFSDEWLELEVGGDLAALAKKYCGDLGKKTFFDLLPY